jgi:cation transport ATPase
MTQKYQITGMTCSSCEKKLSNAFHQINGVEKVALSKELATATITSQTPLSIALLQSKVDAKYQIAAYDESSPTIPKSNASAFHWLDKAIWKRAGFNTLNCLIGCSIGDFGMIIFLNYFYPNTPLMLQMVLAIIAGLITSIALETSILFYKENLSWNKAFKTAIGMSFLSMVAMEIAMNTTDFMITGGQISMTDANYWLAFIPAALMGFLVPLPYNYYQLKRYGRGCH